MNARVLIVEDDGRQLSALSRLVSMRRRDLTVLTARHGADALEVLEAGAIDFVLTDLQMPEMDGFELLAWIASNRPHMGVIAMTAYPDVISDGRMRELGGIECFTKPLDVGTILERIDRVLGRQSGHLRDIGLPSLLQVLEMERKSSVLTVQSDGQVGHLYLDGGELVDASCGSQSGDDAALAILGWQSPSITLHHIDHHPGRTVERAMGFLIMEAMRVADERSRPTAPEEEEDHRGAVVPETPAGPPLPEHVIAIGVVDLDGDGMSHAVGDWSGLEAVAELAAHVWEMSAEEVILTSSTHWIVARSAGHRALAVVAVEPHPARLKSARAALADVAARVNESHSA
ncbi:MAG: response regulator [Deltaproteobacteria bacterium]|nr:response regulator [Deltaproteobacteria bacterium]